MPNHYIWWLGLIICFLRKEIKDYGEACYIDTLKRALDSDENFASSIDRFKSADEVYKMPEGFKFSDK